MASLAPEGIVAEAVDVYGEVVARVAGAGDPSPGAGAGRPDAARASPARSPAGRSGSPSSAPPIPWTARPGGWSSCPDAPFLLGALDAPAVLADLVDGPVTVDNDVNWAARAEHSTRARRGTSSTCSSAKASAAPSLSDGEVRRGHAGLAGEIAHVVTVGPGGAAMRLTDVFAALGLRRPGSTAIDVAGAAARAVDDDRRRAGARRGRRAVGGGGAGRSGGRAGRRAVGPRSARAGGGRRASSRRAPQRPRRAAAVEDEPALAAAREAALQQLRDAIVASASAS